MIEEVKIVKADGTEDLEKQVNDLVDSGWQPHISGIINERSQNTGFDFLLMMIKGEEEIKKSVSQDVKEAINGSKDSVTSINSLIAELKAHASYSAELDGLLEQITEKSNDLSGYISIIEED